MDSYQPIYDAVRSKISGGDVGSILERAAYEKFDISFAVSIVQQEMVVAAQEMGRPAVVFKPTLSRDGNMWCALLGENIMEGVAGFGETPAAAMTAFDNAFYHEKAQTSAAPSDAVSGNDSKGGAA